jgi:TPR repeat protein
MNAANQALKNGDYVRAAEEFRKLAEQGNPRAQSHLGYMYYAGEGVPQSFEEAVKWYGKAAVQGDRDAQYNYAVAYAFGEGIKQDYREAAVWYRRAAEQGHVIAQYSLGISYTYGEGVPQDEKLAAEWFMKSAEAGYVNAQVMVGSLYHTGDGLPKDYGKAVEWYRKAADQGNPVAQYNLGAIYRAGKGVPQNTEEALKWYRLAAAQNYEAAKTELANLERAGAGAREKTSAPAPAQMQQPAVAPAEKQAAQTHKPAETAVSAEPVVARSEQAATVKSEAAAAEEPEKSGGFLSTLKHMFKSDTPEEISRVETPAIDTTAPAAGPLPEPVVDEVQVVKSDPVVAEIAAVEEPEPITVTPPDAGEETSAGADAGVQEPPAPAGETRKPLFRPGTTATSISDLTRPRLESLDAIQGESRIITPTPGVPEPPVQETIAEPVTVPDETLTAASDDSEDKPGGIAGFFGRMFSRDDAAKEAETAVETVAEPVPETAAVTGPPVKTQENPDLRGMEELQIAKADLPVQTTPVETKAGQDLETVTTGSIDILTSRAVTGDPDAQFQLGKNYHEGNNVEKDPVRAFLWYRRAALQGNSEAQFILGNMYLQGEGIEKSEVQARNWFETAARMEHEGARRKLEDMKLTVAGSPAAPVINETEPATVEQAPAVADTGAGEEEGKGGLFGYFRKIFSTDDEETPVQADVTASQTPAETGIVSTATAYSAQNAPAGNQLSGNEAETGPVTETPGTSLEKTAVAEDAGQESSDEPVTAEASGEEGKSGGMFSFFGNLFSSEDPQEAGENTADAVTEGAAVADEEPEPSLQSGSESRTAEPVVTDTPAPEEKPSTAQQEEKITVALATPEIKSQPDPANTSSGAESAADPLMKKLEIEQIRRLAEQGDVIAQARLGYRYYAGEGVEQSYTEAEKWFRKSAVQGDSYAQYNLAVMHAFGEGIPQNMNEAVVWYRRAAEQDHPVAQYSLGFCYAFGEGVPRDEKTAAEWYLKSANNGYIPAQVIIGNTYHSGAGLPQDYIKAAEWFRKAADQGDAAAQFNLGTMYLFGQGVTQSDAQARLWYEKAAAQGHAAARQNLVNLQRIKEEHLARTAEAAKQEPTTVATPASPEPANGEIRTASVDEPQQTAPAQGEKSGGIFSFFGSLFSPADEEQEIGQTVSETAADEASVVTAEASSAATAANQPADTSKQMTGSRATEDIRIAKAETAEQTSDPLESTAEKELSTLPADSIEALTAQAVAGDSGAQLQLGRNYYQGDKVSRDLSLAFLWHRRAALQGNMEAQYTLGNMYLMGEGTAQNDAEARQWYEKAARQGHEAARHNLENLQEPAAAKPATEPVVAAPVPPLPEQEDKKAGMSELVSGLFKPDEETEETDNPPAQVATAPEPATAPAAPKPETGTVPGQKDYERGLAYTYGDGVPQNYNNAFRLFESAASLGHASAQYQLALAYANGHGVPINPSAAIEWYEKAARQGLAIAQRSLGNAYLNGVGVTPNKALAYAWYSILAEQGNVLDIHRRDSIKNQLTEAEIRESENLKKQLSASLSTASRTF